MIIQDDSLKLVGDELTVEPYGGGFKKDDAEFAEFLNGVLDGVQVGRRLAGVLRQVARASTPASSSRRRDQTLEEVLAAG